MNSKKKGKRSLINCARTSPKTHFIRKLSSKLKHATFCQYSFSPSQFTVSPNMLCLRRMLLIVQDKL